MLKLEPQDAGHKRQFFSHCAINWPCMWSQREGTIYESEVIFRPQQREWRLKYNLEAWVSWRVRGQGAWVCKTGHWEEGAAYKKTGDWRPLQVGRDLHSGWALHRLTKQKPLYRMTHWVTAHLPQQDTSFWFFFLHFILFEIGGRVLQGQRADAKGWKDEWDQDAWCGIDKESIKNKIRKKKEKPFRWRKIHQENRTHFRAQDRKQPSQHMESLVEKSGRNPLL